MVMSFLIYIGQLTTTLTQKPKKGFESNSTSLGDWPLQNQGAMKVWVIHNKNQHILQSTGLNNVKHG